MSSENRYNFRAESAMSFLDSEIDEGRIEVFRSVLGEPNIIFRRETSAFGSQAIWNY